MATASKAVKKPVNPPKAKSICIVARCRFKPSKDPDHKGSKHQYYEWELQIGFRNPGESKVLTSTMPFIQFVIFHPHADFGSVPRVTHEAPYQFKAFGYKQHVMLVEVQFKENTISTGINFHVRFTGDDIKKEDKKWSYYEQETNKIFMDFSDTFYNMLVQSSLVQSPRSSPSPPDTTSPASPSALAGGAPINSKHPAMRRSTAKNNASKRSSLSKEVIYEEDESIDDDHTSVDDEGTADSISSGASDTSKSSGKKQSRVNGNNHIGRKTIASTSASMSPRLGKKKSRNSIPIDDRAPESSEGGLLAKSKSKQPPVKANEHSINTSKSKANGVSNSSIPKHRKLSQSNNASKPHVTGASSTTSSKTNSTASTTAETGKRKRALDEGISASVSIASSKDEEPEPKRAKSVAPQTTESKEPSLGDDTNMDVDEGQDRVFRDEKGTSFTLDDLYDRIESADLQGRPVVEIMCIVKRAKDGDAKVDYVYTDSFDFDLDTLPERAVMELWSLVRNIREACTSTAVTSAGVVDTSTKRVIEP